MPRKGSNSYWVYCLTKFAWTYSGISENVRKYLGDFLISEARALGEKKPKHKEHSAMARIREMPTLNHMGRRAFRRAEIDRLKP
jgi:hypothetical protein